MSVSHLGGSSSSSSSSSSSPRAALSLEPSRFSSSEGGLPPGVSAALSLQRELPKQQQRVYESLKKHEVYVVSGSFTRKLDIPEKTLEKISFKASQILYEKGIDSRGKEISLDLTGQRIKLTSKDPATGAEKAEHISLSFEDLQEEIEAVQEERAFTARKCSSILKGDENEPFALKVFSEDLRKSVQNSLKKAEGAVGLLQEILSKTNFTRAQKQDRLQRFRDIITERRSFIRKIQEKKEAVEREAVLPGTPAYEQKRKRLEEIEAFLKKVEKADVFALMLVVLIEETPSLEKKQEFLEKIISSFLGEKDPKNLSSQDKEYIKDILAISLNSRAEAEDTLRAYRRDSIEELLYKKASPNKRGAQRVPFASYVREHTGQFFTDPSKEIVDFFAEEYQEELVEEEEDPLFVTPPGSPGYKPGSRLDANQTPYIEEMD